MIQLGVNKTIQSKHGMLQFGARKQIQIHGLLQLGARKRFKNAWSCVAKYQNTGKHNYILCFKFTLESV